jgi:hypothetical protein
LIEILIAVIILGLGLLGLAALFPVVIREQRIGTDNLLGVTVGNSARAVLKGADWSRALPPRPTSWGLARADDQWDLTTYASWNPWEILRVSQTNDDDFSGLARGGSAAASPSKAVPGNGTSQLYELGEWSIPKVLTVRQTASAYATEVGAALLGRPTQATYEMGIPLDVRLYPAGTSEPGMVWDFAVQRISDFNYQTGPRVDGLRAAIFVRRIDQRIRVPQGATLRDVLLGAGSVMPADRRLPLGEDSMGLPTLDGTGGTAGSLRYSSLKLLNVTATGGVGAVTVEPPLNAANVDKPITALSDVDTSTVLGTLLAQPGQKFVDNLGNICTITRVERIASSANMVRCEFAPPIPAAARQQPTNGLDSGGRPLRVGGRTRITQILFAPQIPAGVVLTEIEP